MRLQRQHAVDHDPVVKTQQDAGPKGLSWVTIQSTNPNMWVLLESGLAETCADAHELAVCFPKKSEYNSARASYLANLGYRLVGNLRNASSTFVKQSIVGQLMELHRQTEAVLEEEALLATAAPSA